MRRWHGTITLCAVGAHFLVACFGEVMCPFVDAGSTCSSELCATETRFHPDHTETRCAGVVIDYCSQDNVMDKVACQLWKEAWIQHPGATGYGASMVRLEKADGSLMSCVLAIEHSHGAGSAAARLRVGESCMEKEGTIVWDHTVDLERLWGGYFSAMHEPGGGWLISRVQSAKVMFMGPGTYGLFTKIPSPLDHGSCVSAPLVKDVLNNLVSVQLWKPMSHEDLRVACMDANGDGELTLVDVASLYFEGWSNPPLVENVSTFFMLGEELSPGRCLGIEGIPTSTECLLVEGGRVALGARALLMAPREDHGKLAVSLELPKTECIGFPRVHPSTSLEESAHNQYEFSFVADVVWQRVLHIAWVECIVNDLVEHDGGGGSAFIANQTHLMRVSFVA